MKTIAIYSRKSKETEKGESTKVQIRICKEYFKKYGECKFEVFEDDGWSGGNTNRPEFQRMMLKVKAKEFDIVSAYKLDRIARNITDFFNIYSELEAYNTLLVSVTEGFDPATPTGKMMMLMLAGFADMERENIRQRVKDNMLELAKQGKWSGGTLPLGYEAYRATLNGKQCSFLKLDVSKKHIVSEIYDLFLNGYSTRKIAKEINDKYKMETSPKRISNILYNPLYAESSELLNKYLEHNGFDVYGIPNNCGYLSYSKTKVTSDGSQILNKENKTIVSVSRHEAIIPTDIWISANQRLKEITQDPKPRKSQYTFLSHLVRCGYCNAPMQVYYDSRKKGSNKRYFRKTCSCIHVGQGNNFRGSRLTVENAESCVKIFLTQCEDINFLKSQISLNGGIKDKANNNIERINKELNKLNKIITGLTDKLALANDDVVEIIMNRLEVTAKQKKDMQEELLVLERKKSYQCVQNNNINLIHNNIKVLVKKFDEFEIEEKQRLISNILKCVSWKGVEKLLTVEILDV